MSETTGYALVLADLEERAWRRACLYGGAVCIGLLSMGIMSAIAAPVLDNEAAAIERYHETCVHLIERQQAGRGR